MDYCIVSVTNSGLGDRLRIDRRRTGDSPDDAAFRFVTEIEHTGEVVSEVMVLSDSASVMLPPVRAKMIREK